MSHLISQLQSNTEATGFKTSDAENSGSFSSRLVILQGILNFGILHFAPLYAGFFRNMAVIGVSYKV